NGDGFADLVVPPQRGGSNGLPTIFLGDGKGHWKTWKTFWPYRIDYGAAATGDFNKDGKMDVAFSVHLQGVRLFLGDGKGNYLASGNFNGDRTPDFFGSSVYFQAHNLLYMSDKTKKLSWAPAANLDEGKIVPFLSYYTAMAAGPFSSKKLDDVIVSYLRFWQS